MKKLFTRWKEISFWKVVWSNCRQPFFLSFLLFFLPVVQMKTDNSKGPNPRNHGCHGNSFWFRFETFVSRNCFSNPFLLEHFSIIIFTQKTLKIAPVCCAARCCHSRDTEKQRSLWLNAIDCFRLLFSCLLLTQNFSNLFGSSVSLIDEWIRPDDEPIRHRLIGSHTHLQTVQSVWLIVCFWLVTS